MDSPDVISTPAQAAQEPGTELELLPPRPAPLVQWRSDRGATTAEYAITTLATYIAPGRTYFTLAGVPVRTG